MWIKVHSKILSVAAVVCALGIPGGAQTSHAKENGKAKGKQKIAVKENHGREAGELPFGLEQHTEKKGALPKGLQKKKDEEGALTRGLEQGGKTLKSTPQAKKNAK